MTTGGSSTLRLHLGDALTGLHIGEVLPSMRLSGGCAMGEPQLSKVGVQGSSQGRWGLEGGLGV